ncbi:two-component sensor histidine kinase [Prauserella marina]|uniref:histidine kinase n=1 Tax=Prauserella marina TaxID=530584 RepID=A0A222VVL5_9PSEU|nr:ATP-binding protein [Prauserella marina]ASR37944.1 two-component sensor histidine kinase [Prauserella marina]PWV73157.1 signal transduction histidine kinase [Prauserella marina]SDD70509.1 Signal transduction histidine kinase [Prauserella marina]
MISPRNWWIRRSLQSRITLLATTVTLVLLFGLAALAGKALGPLLTSSVDDELQTQLTEASADVARGTSPSGPHGIDIRVLDIAGNPVDGGQRPELTASDVSDLKAGLRVRYESSGDEALKWRWLGSVVTAPDGMQRLVAVGAPMVGSTTAVADGSRWLLVVALIGSIVAALATWLGVRAALRPVGRMRRSVRALPPGRRLPLPSAHDELRALASDFNALLARQEEVSERLRRFTGDAAHELRSPVASIRVQSEVAVANPDPEFAQETLADVLAESERLSALLDGLLALARADAGEVPPTEPVELVSEARAAVARLPSGAPEARVSAVVPTAWALATHAEVELVLNNLLRNAARYAESRIVVSVLASRSRVRVVIDDDGPGIAPEHRERVFDRFYRVGDDRARSSGGTGLGLAMVAEAVRRRGGSVTVGDSPDGGARFQVSWRRYDAGTG